MEMFPDFEENFLLESLRKSDYDTEKAVNSLLGEDENAQKGFCKFADFCILSLLFFNVYLKVYNNGNKTQGFTFL